MSNKISVTVLSKNSERYIKDVLNALTPFDEVILYDTGSTDKTLTIAEKFSNVKILNKEFIGFGATHNEASAQGKNNWILSIDSDEIVSKELAESILKEPLDLNTLYSFPRHNFYNGKFIKGCGWYPDYQMRLYNKSKTQFSDAQVHESLISKGMKHIFFKGPITHYSYHTLNDFLAKMQSYSSLFAKQYEGKKKSSLTKALSHGFFAFFKSYILKRGFLSGYEGFVISSYNGHTAYYKYLKLYEANSNRHKY